MTNAAIMQKPAEWLTHLFPMHPFSTPLKTLENLKVFCCFQGVEKGALETNGLNQLKSIDWLIDWKGLKTSLTFQV